MHYLNILNFLNIINTLENFSTNLVLSVQFSQTERLRTADRRRKIPSCLTAQLRLFLLLLLLHAYVIYVHWSHMLLSSVTVYFPPTLVHSWVAVLARSLHCVRTGRKSGDTSARTSRCVRLLSVCACVCVCVYSVDKRACVPDDGRRLIDQSAQ